MQVNMRICFKNLSYIRDEIDGLCAYIDELFGEENMGECKSYLRMLKKLV